MKETYKTIGIGTSRLIFYIGMVIFTALPMLFLIYLFAGYFTKSEDEEIATAATLLFLIGIFIGRFLANLWKNRAITNAVLLTLFFILLAGGFLLAFTLKNSFDHQEFLVFVLAILMFFLESILLGLIIKLIRDKVYRQLNTAETSAATSHSELALLQSQLSPHFLFNTLNNLYGISMHEHAKLPPLLLKLSELLRYSVYGAKEMYVPLKDEIVYIKNYIDFERLRIGERLDLKLELDEFENSTIKIAPMMLIVFVENAFKHSKNTQDERIFVEIGLKLWGNSILFRVKNSCNKQQNNEAQMGGLGLENVKKRLKLLYPNMHDLAIKETAETFEIKLRLDD